MGMYGFSTRAWTAGILAVLLLAGVVSFSVGPLTVGDITSDDGPDAPVDAGPFTELDMATYAVALNADDDADSLYLIEADADLPDEYGDYTADVENDILDELSSDDYHEAEVDETEAGNDIFGFTENDIRDGDIRPGATYHVVAHGENIHNYFGEYTVPETVELQQYDDRIPYTITTDYWDEATALTVDEEQVMTEEGSVASDDLQMNTGLDSAIDDIYDDDAFEAVVELEVEDGTMLFGAVSGASIADDHMDEVTVQIHVNGATVYDETVAADDASNLNEDFVEDEMDHNPVTADDDVVISVAGEMDDRDRPADTDEVVLVSFTVEDLEEDHTYDFELEG